jgi:carbon starvation protein
MTTLLIAIGAFVGYLVAYHTYGRWLARKIFNLDPQAEVPSRQLQDNVDYIPTKREVIFGHHFTSIAGTGPIVGPAVAVFWGWLPALLWVIFGSIFIGAVHDLGALVVSLRNRGQTVGEIAGRVITPRAKILFLLILFFALTIVLAIFGLVIASIFKLYPETVLSVWIEIPIAIAVGYWVYRRGGGLLIPSLLALGLMYGALYIGVYYLPVNILDFVPEQIATKYEIASNATIIWTVILLVYCFFASVLPVWTLLQPRDYINSHQLLLALGLLVVGLLVAAATGQADINSAPHYVKTEEIANAPPILPFLFITIACGAVSGFHCLVSSGTTSKQLSCEPDAQYVGYGAMLLEGALAVIVILACCAGVGMGKFDRVTDKAVAAEYTYEQRMTSDGQPLAGNSAWNTRYDAAKGWGAFGLGAKVGAFIEGGANFMTTIGVPLKLAIGIVAVLVASFAATTLDTATRLQRYVVQELAASARIKPLTNKYAATALALLFGGAMAMLPGPKGVPGTGGLILWPLFGAVNQLLAGMAFLVMMFYLWRRNKPIWFAVVPTLMMIGLPAWALLWQMFNATTGWYHTESHLLMGIAVAVMALQIWMVVEAMLMWPRAKGVLEEALPPLESKVPLAGGRSC